MISSFWVVQRLARWHKNDHWAVARLSKQDNHLYFKGRRWFWTSLSILVASYRTISCWLALWCPQIARLYALLTCRFERLYNGAIPEEARSASLNSLTPSCAISTTLRNMLSRSWCKATLLLNLVARTRCEALNRCCRVCEASTLSVVSAWRVLLPMQLFVLSRRKAIKNCSI